MILVGYPGIGKKTLIDCQDVCPFKNHYVNLDEYNGIDFYRDDIGKDEMDFIFDDYVGTAISVHSYGNVVMVSSSAVIRKLLRRAVEDPNSQLSSDDVVYCFPHINMKNDWLARLRQQYNYTYHKDVIRRNRYKQAELCYDNNISSMITDVSDMRYPHIIITDMDYVLNGEIERLTM